MSSGITLDEDTFDKLGSAISEVREVKRNLEEIGRELLTGIPESIPSEEITMGVSRVAPRGDSSPRSHMWLMFARDSEQGFPELIHPELLVGEDDEGPYAALRFNAENGRDAEERDRLASRIAADPSRFTQYLQHLDGFEIEYKPSYRDEISKPVEEVTEEELEILGETGLTSLLITRRYRPDEEIFTPDFVELSRNIFHDIFFPILIDYTFPESEGFELDLAGRDFKKIVAESPTNYILAYQQGIWAFRDSEHYRTKLNELEKGDIVLFELTTPENGPEENVFIGFGIFYDKGEKEEFWFPDEKAENELKYPLYLRFSDIYWLGDVTQISDAPLDEKSDEQISNEEQYIGGNAVSRQEIIDETGYHIPQMNLESVNQYNEEIIDIIRESGELTHRHYQREEPTNGSGDVSFFILKTGSDEYADVPSEQYHFKEGIPGSNQIRETERARFVYLEDGRFYAKGEIGEIEPEERDGETHYFAEVVNYEEIESVDFDEVRDQITPDFPKQYGIIKITEDDYRLLVGEVDREIDLQQIFDEVSRPEIYRNALTHLIAGKNVVFYGPPGTGKTRAARILCSSICEGFDLVTANAEWSNHQVVGGYKPAGGTWEPDPGFLTEVAQACETSINDVPPRPTWLIIDELNRANLDEAFGDVFTLLDIDYRTTEPLAYADQETYVPLSFRILATMNTYDQAQLFSLGYAFRRRFAFVSVPSLLADQDEPEIDVETEIPIESPSLSESRSHVVSVVQEAAIEALTNGSQDQGVCDTDVATVIPELAEEQMLRKALQELRENEDLQTDDLDMTETLVYFTGEITDSDVIDVGQALLIDAIKYMIAHQLLFPDEIDRSTLDNAVVAYIVPQFEHFMSELRRAETIDRGSDSRERFERIIQLSKDLYLPKTATILEEAVESKRILS